jgi:hypothetical protein
MSKVRFVGLDVHNSSTVIAVADSDRSEPSVVCEIPHAAARVAMSPASSVRCTAPGTS